MKGTVKQTDIWELGDSPGRGVSEASVCILIVSAAIHAWDLGNRNNLAFGDSVGYPAAKQVKNNCSKEHNIKK